MKHHARSVALVAAAVVLLVQSAFGQSAPAAGSSLSRDQMEAFLLKAKIVETEEADKGITGTRRATLSDGVTTHDASIQTIDQRLERFKSARGVEMFFRDAWQFNVAAYRLDKLLDLNMIPATVERTYDSRRGSFTWWVDDVAMDEGERVKRKAQPPNQKMWNEQIWIVRAFDQLIYNTDRNAGNMLITSTWRVWMIDHTRAFRMHMDLQAPRNLSRLDRQVLARLRTLDATTVQRELGDYLSRYEIDAMLSRRDLIVKYFDEAGEAVVFDRQPPP